MLMGKGADDEIRVRLSKTGMAIFCDTTLTVSIRPLLDPYPEMGVFFVLEGMHSIVFQTKEVRDILERVKAISDDAYKMGVALTFEHDEVIFRKIDAHGHVDSNTDDVGTLEERVSAVIPAALENVAVSVNHNYLIDALAQVKTETFSFRILLEKFAGTSADGKKVCRMAIEGDGSATKGVHIIVPLRA